MNKFEVNQNGFSLLELLFSITLIMILSGIVTQSYSVYKQKAQHSSAIVLFNQARASLEGGKINSESENFSSPVMEVEETGPGLPGGEFGQILLQGLVLPAFHKVYVRHVTACDEPTCVEDVISVRHCQTNKVATLTNFHGGTSVVDLQALAGGACS
jgi:Tfp pilus assembly major pilin PilA